MSRRSIRKRRHRSATYNVIDDPLAPTTPTQREAMSCWLARNETLRKYRERSPAKADI